MLSEKTNFAGRSWWYPFRYLPQHCDKEKVARFSNAFLKNAALLTKAWSDHLNSEWVTRIYFSAKMVLGASLDAQSLEYASAKNLRVVVPYLEYYTVLHCLRAVVLTNPSVHWNGGKICDMTHRGTISAGVQILKQIDPGLATEFLDAVLSLKNMRELISYFAPSSGDFSKQQDVEVLETSRFLLEVAQMQSELFEVSVLKNVTGTYALERKWIEHAFYRFDKGKKTTLDTEDYYRMDYLRRKHAKPTNIHHVISEGHAADFFGSWCPEGDCEGKDLFNPDEDWRIIFDVP
jgi:hypothetical protein